MDPSIDEIDLQVPLSSDILTDGPLDSNQVQYEPNHDVQSHSSSQSNSRSISDEYLINQAAPWTKKENSPLTNQTYYLQTQYVQSNDRNSKSDKLEKPRAPPKKRKQRPSSNQTSLPVTSSRTSGSEQYKFSCDRCELTFSDPKEAIAHISEKHMARPSISRNAGKFQYDDVGSSNQEADMRNSTNQGPLLLLVDDNNQLIETDDDRNFDIQYAEMPHPDLEIQSRDSNFDRISQKTEMMHHHQNQQQEQRSIGRPPSKKRPRKSNAQRYESVVTSQAQQTFTIGGDMSKVNMGKRTNQKQKIRSEIIQSISSSDLSVQSIPSVVSTTVSNAGQMGSSVQVEQVRKPRKSNSISKIQIEPEISQNTLETHFEHESIGRVVHINQLENGIMEHMIEEENDNSDLQHLSNAPGSHQNTGQSSVVVPNETLEMEADMVQFSNNMDDGDHDGIDPDLGKYLRLGKYLCDLCPSVFTSKAGLNDHVKSFHLGEKRFACDKCGKMFFRKNKLLQHMDGHAEEKMHICHVCGKRFQFKTSLVHHLNCHSENPRFKCQFCGKILSAHKMLLKHLVKQHNQQVDEDLVPIHKCDICNYKTIYKSDLTKHKRKHTGEKPYRCPICYKEFSDSSILRRHEVVHTGEKPWKCYLCDKAYTLRSTLTNHFKKAHSTWPNPIPACPICKREFENREDIFNHMKEVHGTDPATAQSLSAHLQTLKERVGGCIVGGKAGTNQEIVVPKPTIINGLDGNQFQIVMNGEPLQIIPVEPHETHMDGESRHIITNDGQQLEVILQDQVYEEPGRRILKMDQDVKILSENDIRKMGLFTTISKDTNEMKFCENEKYPRIVMMDEHTGKYNVQLVSGGQTIGQQQIIYTEQSDTHPVVSKPMTSSVVMTSSMSPHQSSSSQLRDPSQLRDQVSLIQTVSVPSTSQSPDQMTSQ